MEHTLSPRRAEPGPLRRAPQREKVRPRARSPRSAMLCVQSHPRAIVRGGGAGRGEEGASGACVATMLVPRVVCGNPAHQRHLARTAHAPATQSARAHTQTNAQIRKVYIRRWRSVCVYVCGVWKIAIRV
eukprot:1996398-Pyramimonas_sp.AAC.3